MTVAVSTWLKDALPRTPGAVRSVVTREFMLAVREFYEQSFAWRETVGPLSITAGDADITLSPFDSDSDVIGILGAAYNKNLLRKMPAPPVDIARESDAPSRYYVRGTDTIVMWPTPTVSADDALLVYVALTPTLTTTSLPDIASTLHREALLDGLLGRLYAHPAKPYSNPLLAQHHMKRFRNHIGAYAAKAKMGNANAPSWCFPAFGK